MKPHILVELAVLKVLARFEGILASLISPSHAPHFTARARFSSAAVWQVTSRQEEFVFCAGDAVQNERIISDMS